MTYARSENTYWNYLTTGSDVNLPIKVPPRFQPILHFIANINKPKKSCNHNSGEFSDIYVANNLGLWTLVLDFSHRLPKMLIMNTKIIAKSVPQFFRIRDQGRIVK